MYLNRSSITICLLVLLTGFGGLLVSFSSLYLYLSPKLPAVETLRNIKLSTPLRIYSTDGKLIDEFGEIKRVPVQLTEVPPLLIKALIAIEDHDFYSHNGVNLKLYLHAVSQYLLSSGTTPGASTLTMQVAKNAFNLENDRSLLYKGKQTLLALQIEKELSKGEILELYLNLSFLGKRAYGIGAAAQVYYGKTIGQLTLAQMASLVGTYKSPSSVNPISNPERSLRRRNLVLSEMLELGDIDQLQYEEATAETINAKEHDRPIELYAPYVAEMARQDILELVPKGAYEDGYVVYVTIDSKLQEAAQDAVINGLLNYDIEKEPYRGPEEFSLEPIFVEPEQARRDSLSHLTAIDEANEVIEPLETSEPPAIQNVARPLIYEIVQQATEAQIQEASDALNRDFNVTRINVSPWVEALNNISTIADLKPAAVLEAKGDKLVVLLDDGEFASIEWDNGPSGYLRPNSRAPAANQKVLSLGNIVRVIEGSPGQWHLTQVPEVQGAFVAINPKNGAIKALVGGLDFNHNNFNRVEQATRPLGSNFKPLMYTAALENGFSAGSIINDQPYTQYDRSREGNWTPENDDGKFLGPMRLRVALYRSRNIVSVRLLSSLGHSKAFKNIERFGINYSDLPKNDLSLALGTYELTPRQVATAYAVFANGGYKVDSHFVDRIESADGEIIFQALPSTVCANCEADENQEHDDSSEQEITENKDTQALQENPQTAAISLENAAINSLELQLLAALDQFDKMPSSVQKQPEIQLPEAPRVMDERTAYIIDDILKDVIKKGSGRKARSLSRGDIGGKTGTTNNATNAWFSGYSSSIVATAWVGFDDNRSLGSRVFGSSVALPIWTEFMETALNGVPEIERPMPVGLEWVRINSQTGEITGPEDPKAVMEIFKIENSPSRDKNTSETIFDKNEVNPVELF